MSAVCAYSISAIREIFNEGKFKTPVAVETSHVKWVMYTGEVPVPRPGAVRLMTLAAGRKATSVQIEKSKMAVFVFSVHQ